MSRAFIQRRYPALLLVFEMIALPPLSVWVRQPARYLATVPHLCRSVSRSRYVGGAYAYTHKPSTSRVYRQLRGDGGIYLKAIGNKQVLLAVEAVGLRFRFDNPIGFPYIVLRWIEGTPLEWSDNVPQNRESRNKILY